MMRYHPSVDFSPAKAPTKSIASKKDTSSHEDETDSEPSRLQSLLDFVRWENERERASLKLDTFLLRIKSDRDEVEATLKKETAVCSYYNQQVVTLI